MLTPENLQIPLLSCGYRAELLRSKFRLSDGSLVPLVAFGQLPTDSRSACIAVLSKSIAPRVSVEHCRELGAPVVFVCMNDSIQWWKQGSKTAELVESVPESHLETFFDVRRSDFSPDAIYRAKTWGRFQTEYQKSFVDLGLMPLVEENVGQEISRLIVQTVGLMKSALKWGNKITDEQGHWLLKSVFWLVSGKILRDKHVASFANLDLRNATQVFEKVGAHFGTNPPSTSGAKRDSLDAAALAIATFSNLALTTTESLAHVYENTLISDATRSSLGTHSTPSYLVEYVVGNLANWIAEIPEAERSVFEPACGHAAFLCSAMRLLSELLPNNSTSQYRGKYLRSRLHGTDVDEFALELARLSLTLTDIPNPNGWDLKNEDMFVGTRLSEQAERNTIFLANPPFESLKPEERAEYSNQGVTFDFTNRAAEMLWKTIPHLSPGSVFGVVLPQTLLETAKATKLRKHIAETCELKEICLFPDKVFSFSEAESVVILGRKREVNGESKVKYRRVREGQIDAFRERFAVSRTQLIAARLFLQPPTWSLLVPDLSDIWEQISKETGGDHHLIELDAIAYVGQGLIYKGEDLPSGASTYSSKHFPEAVEGYVHFDLGIQLHETPTPHWMNLDDAVIRRPVTGTTVGVPQVLCNYSRVSRGPWRLKALIDPVGKPVSSRFITVRPRLPAYPLEILWALLNSPIANAFACCHLQKRDNLVGVMRQLPVPRPGSDFETSVAGKASRYLELAKQNASAETLRSALSEVDAAVLRLYALPFSIEWSLLELFRGFPRVGISFIQSEYVPAELVDRIRFHDFIAFEKDWPATNKQRGQLIDKKISGTLTSGERVLLESLQSYADYYLDSTSPPDTAVLDEIYKRLEMAQGGN